MKNFLFLSMALLLFRELTNCQDLIIPKNGDTIRCSVTKIDSNVIYFKMVFHDKIINTNLERNEISELIVPVLPDNPKRIMFEKRIKTYSTIGSISVVSYVFGGVLTFYGFIQSFQGILNTDETSFNKGGTKIAIGIPFLVTGAIVGSISISKAIKYKNKLKNLYKLSINMDYSPSYKGLSITYKF
jgi:hypothetical protein